MARPSPTSSPRPAAPPRAGRSALLRRCWAAMGLSALLLNPAAVAHAEDIVVIMNKDNPNTVNAEFIVRIYTGTLKGWPDGTPVLAYDQSEEAEARELFCTQVLRKSPANVKAIWSQNIFTGKGLPPKIAGTDTAVKALVSSHRHAIGYIRASQVDDTVKVIGR
jgi:ABC-type phosphate transport system substrate-binding protein